MIEGYIGIRTLALLGLLVLLVWAIIWPIWKLKQKPSLFWIVLLSGLIIGVGYFEAKWLIVQSQATQLTQEISKNEKGYAVCQRFTPAFLDAQMSTLGFVAYSEGNKSNIKYAQCKKFGEFLETDKTQLTEEHVLAVGVVIHEAIHVGGEYDEAVTQCLTMKQMPDVLKQYGVSEQNSAIYADKYREMSKRMPPEYLNGTC